MQSSKNTEILVALKFSRLLCPNYVAALNCAKNIEQFASHVVLCGPIYVGSGEWKIDVTKARHSDQANSCMVESLYVSSAMFCSVFSFQGSEGDLCVCVARKVCVESPTFQLP